MRRVSEYRFSLVTATRGRTHELLQLLQSLEAQTCKSFELILVDQNPPGLIPEILRSFDASFPIVYLRSMPGLSLARNVGLTHVRGEVVTFPDDDCWYPPTLLESVSSLLDSHPEWDGVTGRPIDPADPTAHAYYEKTSGSLDLANVWHRCTSFTIFLRRRAMEVVGRFNADLGRGSASGMVAAEDTEYLIRALRLGCDIFNSAELCVWHREMTAERRLALVLGESRALGYVLRSYDYPLGFVVNTWIRPIGGAILAALRGRPQKSRYYLRSLRGRVRGWLVDSLPDRSLDRWIVVSRRTTPLFAPEVGAARER